MNIEVHVDGGRDSSPLFARAIVAQSHDLAHSSVATVSKAASMAPPTHSIDERPP